MRLIDADKLVGDLDVIEIVAYTNDKVYEYISTDQINNAPTIDAVPLEQYRSMERTCYKLQKALYEMAERKDEPQTDVATYKFVEWENGERTCEKDEPQTERSE